MDGSSTFSLEEMSLIIRLGALRFLPFERGLVTFITNGVLLYAKHIRMLI